MFSWECCEIVKNIFFYRATPKAAFVWNIYFVEDMCMVCSEEGLVHLIVSDIKIKLIVMSNNNPH